MRSEKRVDKRPHSLQYEHHLLSYPPHHLAISLIIPKFFVALKFNKRGEDLDWAVKT